MAVFISTEDQDLYLAHIRATGRKAQAAEKIGLTGQTVVAFAKLSPEFAAKLEHALALYYERLEEEIDRRGREGYEEEVFDKDGNQSGVRTRYSDRLLLEHARRHIAEYKEKVQNDVNLSGGVLVIGSGEKKTPSEWAEMYKNENERNDPEDQDRGDGNQPKADG